MHLLKRLQIVAVLLLSFTVIAGCGGDGGSSVQVPVQTIQFQPDGTGSIRYFTNDAKWLGYSTWHSVSQSYESQMTTVTAVVRKDSGANGTGFGIIFCNQDTNNLYRLWIDAYGHYSLYSKVAGVYSTLIPWTAPHSAVINPGLGATNVISVTQYSLHNFSISFNGIEETTFSDSNFTGGAAGYSVAISSVNDYFPLYPVDVKFRMTAPVVDPSTARLVPTASTTDSTDAGDAGAQDDNLR